MKLKNLTLFIGLLVLLILPVIIWGVIAKCQQTKDFWINYMIYFGTVALAEIVVLQNYLSLTESKKMKKVEKISLMSFVKLIPKIYTGGAMGVDIMGIGFDEYGEDCAKGNLVLFADIENTSNYPITALKGRIKRNGNYLGKEKVYEAYNFFINSRETVTIMLRTNLLDGYVPETDETFGCLSDFGGFAYYVEDEVTMELEFTNVFGLVTSGRILFENTHDGQIYAKYMTDNYSIDM